MNDKELITYLLGELEKISSLEPKTGFSLTESVDNLISIHFKAKHTALMAIIEAEKHLKN